MGIHDRNYGLKDREEKMNYGTVKYKGKTYTLTQIACADNGPDGTTRYYARAEDAQGVVHEIVWETTDDWNAHQNNPDHPMHVGDWSCGWCEDESNACDWDNPIIVQEA